MTNQPVFLASKSPRRAQLLTQMGLVFEVIETRVDETPHADETPHNYVARLARTKAQDGYWRGPGAPDGRVRAGVVIGADTIVVLDGEILGKPGGQMEAEAMLLRLSGRSHEVLTGVALFDGERLESVTVPTVVQFCDISRETAAAYWHTGEPADKAGSYGIQGIGGIFAERVEGNYSAVVGLPVDQTEVLLQRFNIDTWSMRIDGRRTPD